MYASGVKPSGGGGTTVKTAQLDVQGVADVTQVQFAIESIYPVAEAESFTETVDTDAPTGGTYFDISADGSEVTIKGFAHNILTVLGAYTQTSNVGTTFYYLNARVEDNKVVFSFSDGEENVLDLSGLASDKAISIVLTFVDDEA